jgi:hypothetical protein
MKVLLLNLMEKKIMGLSEKALDYLEEHIPELAEVAFKQAYWAALASGSSVLVSENGSLVEVFPDGTRKFIKELPAWIPVKRGQRLELK